ncbi:MAG: hypothetical protein J5I99_09005 [Verrucomicrobia bacterium]|nr:hypothetical protein [Verrucomicrobiota bacterium]
MPKPNNITQRSDLTTYAFGIQQDEQEARNLIKALAPVVPTGGTTGRFNKFEDTQSFKAYTNALRAVGGQSNEIKFLSDTDDYNVKPYGLRISIDEFERKQAGDQVALLEQAKTRTLTINCILSHLASVVSTVKASVSAVNGKGNWSGPNVDPINELDGQIEAMWNATGMVPNKLLLDFGAWIKLRNNPKVAARLAGSELAALTPEKLSALLAVPVKVSIVTTAILAGGGLANPSATKAGALGAGVSLLLHNSDMPTQYDPSFCKTFAESENLFTEVYQYRQEPHLDWFENNWAAEVQVVAPALCRRIDVT